MSDNKKCILAGLNKIFDKLGPYGGHLCVHHDWDFYCKVYDMGNSYEAVLYSTDLLQKNGPIDPLFRMEIAFNEDRSEVIDVHPFEYISQFLGFELHMNLRDENSKYTGECESMEADIEERLCSYIKTITEIRPYLTDPYIYICFEEDIKEY